MRLLFVMASAEYLRYYDETLLMLARRGHSVIVATNRGLRGKAARLESLAEQHPLIALGGRVPKRADRWRSIAKAVRGSTDYVRFLHPRFGDADALRLRMYRKALPAWLRVPGLSRLRSLPAPVVRGLITALGVIERAIPVSPVIEAFIRETHPDALIVSPLVDRASEQVDLVKAARALGMPVGVAVASWDNLTNKGLLRIQPDAVYVWNETQKREAVEFHGVAPGRVIVTGAQPFDRWFDRAASERALFCRRVGLPATRQFVLFVGSTAFISAPHAEVDFVRRWIAAIRASDDPRLRDLAVLVRPHPYNLGDWPTTDLSELGPAVVFPRHGANPVDNADRADYFDSLFHSAAVVGVNTSAMLEAAVVGRPVLTMLAPEFNDTQRGTLHFRYLLPENGGFLHVAATIDESLAQLAAVLENPAAEHARSQRFVQSFIRPFGLDVPATPKLVEAIERLGGTSPSVATAPPPYAELAR